MQRDRERSLQRNQQHQAMHGDLSIVSDQGNGGNNASNASNIAMYVAEAMMKDTTSSISTINNLYACADYCVRLRAIMEEEGKADFDPTQYQKIAMVLEGLSMSAEQCQHSSKKSIRTCFVFFLLVAFLW